MPDITAGLLLQKEKAPAIVRSGGVGGQPHEWEKVIGPTISAEPGEEWLIYVYPEGDRPNEGWDDKTLASAKSKASARAASIANRYWNAVPTEHVETMVRQRPDGSYGVWAVHHGAMTEENREKLARRRAPRGPRLAGDAPGEPAVASNTPSGGGSTPEGAQANVGATAAERAKAAAKKAAAAK